MNNDKTRETHTFKLHDGTENWTSKEARERTIAMVNEYRKKKKQQWWSSFWSTVLAVALIGVCLYIFFFAWPTIE